MSTLDFYKNLRSSTVRKHVDLFIRYFTSSYKKVSILVYVNLRSVVELFDYIHKCKIKLVDVFL